MATPLPAPAESVLWPVPETTPATPEYRRWLDQPLHRSRTTLALVLGIAAVLVPPVGPWCWAFAERELRAIDRGTAPRRGQPRLELARRCGIAGTFLAVAAIGFTVSFFACRL